MPALKDHLIKRLVDNLIQKFLGETMKITDFIPPLLVNASSVGGTSLLGNIDPLIVNIIIMPMAMLVQAVRLSGTNKRVKGKLFLPGDVQQIFETGFASFVVLALAHVQFPTWSLEAQMAVGVSVGWLGLESWRLLRARVGIPESVSEVSKEE